MKQFPLDKTFIISLWLEALVYGFFLCLFCASLYVNFTLRRWQDGHSRAMFVLGVVFWLVATMHLAMNCFRMVRGYVDNVNSPGGAVGYLGNLAPWDHVFKDTLYATQEILGDGVAIYRCWVIWNRNWRVIILPFILFIVSLISGYTVCGLYPSQHPGETVFDPRLTHWISTFYAVAVVQSSMTTGLMAYKIWITDRRSASYRASRSNLRPVLRILVESASLQLVVESILLALYLANYNAQYILLEIVTPLVGITFTAITIRLTLRMSGALGDTKRTVTNLSSNPNRDPNTSQTGITTIGSMPMRAIAINITKDVHLKQDSVSNRSTDMLPSPASTVTTKVEGAGMEQYHKHPYDRPRASVPISVDLAEEGVVIGMPGHSPQTGGGDLYTINALEKFGSPDRKHDQHGQEYHAF
ncbi:hypothetical protein BXZ70DRAFT_429932 [Cristinia sonorae]|uniref:Uncharacterized protein n=1 Tax=Cristinia sonorae TaxID=1940300 RepID=A0A8K0XTX7_9AGAR|nr:hypothetical protein BXZ70DRAFT_429932 [Cristinia sonorae]